MSFSRSLQTLQISSCQKVLSPDEKENTNEEAVIETYQVHFHFL